MNKEEIIEMLHDIAKTVGGFDGQARGLLKINDYVMKLKENTTTENSDVPGMSRDTFDKLST